MKTTNLLQAVLCLLVLSCSVLKKDDPQKEVRAFVTEFQNALSQPDGTILKQFDAKQSREVILSAIKVLQNKEHEFILCEPSYGLADITIIEGSGIEVRIPVAFRTQKLSEKFEKTTSLTLWLTPKKKSYVISRLDADEFYQTFAQLKSQIEWSVERQRELDARVPVYELARKLEHSFDSVIWFSRYGEQHFFYVVNGDWVNWFNTYNGKRPEGLGKMGLTNENGEVVIPIDYDQVGTIAFDWTNLVEVKKDGKFGYFDIREQREVVPAEYDLIIPYRKSNAACIVKKDTVYGWYNSSYVYADGFPDESARNWVSEFKFIPGNLHIDVENYALAEIPTANQAGNGIVIMPSYLSRTGVFDEVVAGISPTAFPLDGGYTDYVETQGSVFESITGSISGLITTIRERYLDGREEFYTHQNLVLVSASHDTLAVARLYSVGQISFKTIDSLLQVKSVYQPEWFEPGDNWETNMPQYYFFLMGEDAKVTKLTSKRHFSMTEFVKLDSSYLAGEFLYWNTKSESEEKKDFLSLETLTFMRNEIFAAYGVKFFSADGYDEHGQFKNLPERTIDEIDDELSSVDQHNVTFLNRVIELMEPKKLI
jgi:hypothetical protein